jgi:peptidoglycan/LPS O-acetylase OafA/YrhL
MRFSNHRIRTLLFPQTAQGHFAELDGMRGVLAIAVMLFHYGLSTIIGQISGGALAGSNWGLCVDFFFLLSGFVLCHSFMRRPVGAGEFLWRRILRLAPMYFVTTVMALFFVPDRFTNFEVDTNVALLQPLFGTQSVNFPAWSVPLELYFPFIAVLAVPLLATMTKNARASALIAAIILGSLACFVYQGDIDLELTRSVAGLSAGALLYVRRLNRPYARASAVLAFGGVAGAVLIMTLSGVLPAVSLLFYPCAMAAIWYGAGAKGLFSTRPFQAAGRWSYSIYLLHIPVLAMAQTWTGSTLQGDVFTKAGVTIVVLALAGLTYWFIEAPLMRLRNWRAPALARTV